MLCCLTDCRSAHWDPRAPGLSPLLNSSLLLPILAAPRTVLHSHASPYTLLCLYHLLNQPHPSDLASSQAPPSCSPQVTPGGMSSTCGLPASLCGHHRFPPPNPALERVPQELSKLLSALEAGVVISTWGMLFRTLLHGRCDCLEFFNL